MTHEQMMSNLRAAQLAEVTARAAYVAADRAANDAAIACRGRTSDMGMVRALQEAEDCVAPRRRELDRAIAAVWEVARLTADALLALEQTQAKETAKRLAMVLEYVAVCGTLEELS